MNALKQLFQSLFQSLLEAIEDIKKYKASKMP
jgi:hypothetical protein